MMIRIRPGKLGKNVTGWALSSFTAPMCASASLQVIQRQPGLRTTALTSVLGSNEGCGFILLPFPRQHRTLSLPSATEGKSIPGLTTPVK